MIKGESESGNNKQIAYSTNFSWFSRQLLAHTCQRLNLLFKPVSSKLFYKRLRLTYPPSSQQTTYFYMVTAFSELEETRVWKRFNTLCKKKRNYYSPKLGWIGYIVEKWRERDNFSENWGDFVVIAKIPSFFSDQAKQIENPLPYIVPRW